MFKRIVLFLITNIAILIVISIILSLFNVAPYLNKYGLDYKSLLIFALIIGFAGSFISLFISKWMAMRAYSIQLITNPRTEMEQRLISIVSQLAKQRNIGMPDVGIYESQDPNAFATGWNKNSALVAVSSGLLANMDQGEIEGVLGHEISHVANGDMVTLTLIQGVLNTFVIFFARVAAFFVSSFFRRDGDTGGGFVFYGVALIFELLFGILATIIVLWFSRHREYRADRGSAKYVGKDKMINALKRLQVLTSKTPEPEEEQVTAFNNFKISGREAWSLLFSSHPPIEKRIAALQDN